MADFDVSKDKIVVSEERMYDKITYEFYNLNGSNYIEGEGEPPFWLLMRYSKQSLTDPKRSFKIHSAYSGHGNDRKYVSHCMFYDNASLSRTISLDSDGYVISDSIKDSIMDPMNVDVFNSADIKSKTTLADYLVLREHTYVNRKDSSDVFKNRWFKDADLEEYLTLGKTIIERHKYLFCPEDQKVYKKV